MKNRSLGLILNIRCLSGMLYHFFILGYGVMVICLYGVRNIGGVNGMFLLLFYMLALLALLLQGESLLKYGDPLNKENRKWYAGMFGMECAEMLLAYLLAMEGYKTYVVIGGYSLCVAVGMSISLYIHRRILRSYKWIRQTGQFEKLLDHYKQEVHQKMDLDAAVHMKGFLKFLCYIIALTFIYKLTLLSWIITGIFAVINGYVLWKLHWDGIRSVISHSKLYFAGIYLCTTIGLIWLKLVYDQRIVIRLFQGRDAQEYLMVWILFFLPLVYYGSKVSVAYMNQRYQWVE